MTDRFRVLWTDVAVDDLLAIIDDVAQHDTVDAAEHVHQRITDAVHTLESLPQRNRVVPELHAEGIDAYRELLIGSYRVMYGVRGRDVVVLAVVDGRRDLGELLVERALRQP